MEPVRISPEEVKKKMESGAAVLVCAYEDEEKFRRVHLKGAISLREFKAKRFTLPKEKEVVLYCA